MDGCTVEIFGLDLSIDKGVQLIDGETNGVEFLFAHVEVGANVFSEEDLTGLFVCVVGADAQKEPEVFAQVLQELGLVVQAKRSSRFQQDLNLVTAI
jgi:hypothetical protein